MLRYLILIFSFFSYANSAEKIPLEIFFQKPEKTNVQISPKGKYISYLAPWKHRLNIFIQTLDSNEIQQITFCEKQDVLDYLWSKEEKIFFLQDKHGDEKNHLFLADIENKKVKDLTPYEEVNCIIKKQDNHPRGFLLFSMNKGNKYINDLYCYNLNTDEISMVAKNPGNVINYLVDNEEQARLIVTTDGLNKSIHIRKNNEEKFHHLLTYNFKDTVEPLFFTFDNKNVYVSSNRDRDTCAICELNLDTGKEKCIFEHPQVDVNTLVKSNNRKTLTEIYYYTDKLHIEFLDEKIQKIYEFINTHLPNYENIIVSNDNNEEKFIILSKSDKNPGSYYLFDLNRWELTKLFDKCPWLKEDMLTSMTPISYIARDGLKIHGYLTIPKDKDPINLPLIVIPHGGPYRRTSWGYRPDVQLLANRGFAILQMNFRGSSGYGKAFREKGFKQWGLNMQDDITDGVLWSINQKIADPKKITIFGYSYGGYAALMGIVKTPDLYCAAISYAGVSNLLKHLTEHTPQEKMFLREVYEILGHPEKDKEQLMQTSPYFHGDKIKTPLFIIYGENDPRVIKSQAEEMVEVLKKGQTSVEVMVKENEGHGFIKEENIFDVYRAIENFLTKHINPD